MDEGGKGGASKSGSGTTAGGKPSTDTGSSSAGASGSGGGSSPKQKGLFNYPVTISSGLLKQLMTEAKDIKCNKFPAAATFLLRNIVETILKHIIDAQKANTSGKTLDLEGCLNLCASNAVTLPNTDKKVLSEFKKDHLLYLNLGSHGNVIPNETRVLQARDTIDQFVKKHV